MRGGPLALALITAAATPAAASEHYCLATSSVNWNVDPPHTILASEDEHGFGGWFEFWVDIESGEWRGRNVGSRAMYSAGGTFTVANDGTGYRDHWVGIEAEAGRESLHIMRTRDPMTFMRIARDGFAEIGTCVPTEGRRFIDGREVIE